MGKHNLLWQEYDDGTVDLIANGEIIGSLKDGKCGEKFSEAVEELLTMSCEQGTRNALTCVGGALMLAGIAVALIAGRKVVRVKRIP